MGPTWDQRHDAWLIWENYKLNKRLEDIKMDYGGWKVKKLKRMYEKSLKSGFWNIYEQILAIIDAF